eukprot:COSAG03_NODE_4410_length_1562_cov_2.145591_2_plen_348_part_00
MSAEEEEVIGADDIRQLVEDELQSSDAANAACRLAGLSIRGNASQKRARFLQLISGPVQRQRRGWADLVLRAVRAGATNADELGPDLVHDDGLPAGSSDFLLDLLERLPAAGLEAPLPAKLLPDLRRDLVDGRVRFSLPANFHFPSLAQVDSFVGHAIGDADVDDRVAQLEQQIAQKEGQILDRLRSDVRDGKLALPADASVSAQRDAFAFRVDPQRVLLLGCDLQPDGVRKILCGPDPDQDPADYVALDQQLFSSVMFNSSVTAKQAAAIHRRNMLPAECFQDAPTLPAKIVGMVGGKAKLQKHEELRIKQQALLKPVQTQFRTLASGRGERERDRQGTDLSGYGP